MKNNSSRTAFIFKKLIIVIQENLVMNILNNNNLYTIFYSTTL